jgi:DNA replication protein DnaC
MSLNANIEKMIKLNLSKMVESYKNQSNNPLIVSLGFDDRLCLLLDSELDLRDTNKINRLIKESSMKLDASIEEIDFRESRNLDKSLIATLAECNWINKGHNVIITGATGCGKSYLSCALGKRACQLKYKVLYFRLPRLLVDLQEAKNKGNYNQLMKSIKKANLLIIDDFGLAILSASESRDLLEIIDDRINQCSCIFVSQIPPSAWYETFNDPTFADAIMDRINYNSYKIELKGPSMRKITSTLSEK